MFGSEILDVAIGLVFVYLVLSSVSSSLVELISRLFKWRSEDLFTAIRDALEPTESAADDVNGVNVTVEDFYRHPLIAKLARSKGRPLIKRGGKPSYIPSRTFAIAILDLAAPSGGKKSRTVSEVRAAVENVGNKDVRETLLPLIDAAGDDLAQAQQNVADWFDDMMERASGWYKRKTQLWILLVALLTTLLVNADTIHIMNELWTDQTLRASVAVMAEGAGSPDAVQRQLQELETATLVGWSNFSQSQPEEASARVEWWASKTIGWLTTWIAVSLGAPFWFELLNKLINLRGAGDKPKKAAESRP